MPKLRNKKDVSLYIRKALYFVCDGHKRNVTNMLRSRRNMNRPRSLFSDICYRRVVRLSDF